MSITDLYNRTARHTDLLRQQRQAIAKHFKARLLDMKADAAAMDAELAKAIADVEELMGEPPVQYQQAAE